MSEPPPLPRSFERADLEDAGFIGWFTWDELVAGGFLDVPAGPAAYVIYRPSDSAPSFRVVNPGGHFKGQDPSVAIPALIGKWVAGCQVVYIGKADNARRRLTQFARFGAGEPVGHRGGRYIWQLEDSGELLVAWHSVQWDETAREYEKRLLAHFAELHQEMLPFANLTG